MMRANRVRLDSPREQADFVRRRVTRVVVGADPYRATASRLVCAQPWRCEPHGGVQTKRYAPLVGTVRQPNKFGLTVRYT